MYNIITILLFINSELLINTYRTPIVQNEAPIKKRRSKIIK